MNILSYDEIRTSTGRNTVHLSLWKKQIPNDLLLEFSKLTKEITYPTQSKMTLNS